MLLLAGGDSEIGLAALERLRARGRDIVATTRRVRPAATNVIRLDLNDSLAAWEPPPGTTSACILAAIARPADCAADPAASAHINVTQTLALAERLLRDGIEVVFISTDQVFDGRVPHTPADTPTTPVSEYGRQKARTEAALLAHMARGAPVAILRLSKVLSPRTNFFQDWIVGLKSGRAIRVFRDKTMAPVPIDTVADAIDALARDRARGLFQLTGPRDVAYTEVARHIVERLGADKSLIASISAASAGLPEGTMPLHTTLDSAAMRERYGMRVPDVLDVIDELLDKTVSWPAKESFAQFR
jgi:dTDP-4-dehydrorhamnose reductase